MPIGREVSDLRALQKKITTIAIGARSTRLDPRRALTVDRRRPLRYAEDRRIDRGGRQHHHHARQAGLPARRRADPPDLSVAVERNCCTRRSDTASRTFALSAGDQDLRVGGDSRSPSAAAAAHQRARLRRDLARERSAQRPASPCSRSALRQHADGDHCNARAWLTGAARRQSRRASATPTAEFYGMTASIDLTGARSTRWASAIIKQAGVASRARHDRLRSPAAASPP